MRAKFRTEGWQPRSEEDHFMTCPTCGERFDCRDLSEALEHQHGEPVEEEPTQH
ncbi:hypothetical protein BF49_5527 [Bradyrhizobium sp.]|nr:hypothetical protein BF49_5527 [Bradyrhizobium sp.]